LVQLDGLTLDITRFYFPPLERETWDSLASALHALLTDAAIDSAVCRMPPETYPSAAPGGSAGGNTAGDAGH
jgi:hypothetical protein